MNEAAQERERLTQTARELVLKAVSDHYTKMAIWIKEIWDEDKTDNYEVEQKYSEALTYFQQFRHNPDVDYSPVLNYLREQYSKLQETDKSLDDKADAIIKYLGGGSALVTFGALFSIKPDSRQALILGAVALCSLLPSLIFAICAIARAISVRRPRPSATFPAADFAVKCAEGYEKEKVEINMWLILHPICEAAIYRNFQKSQKVQAAHWNYRAAVAGLLIPVVSVAVTLVLLVCCHPEPPSRPVSLTHFVPQDVA